MNSVKLNFKIVVQNLYKKLEGELIMKEMFPCGIFQPPGSKVFGVIDDAVVYGKEKIPFGVIENFKTVAAPSPITNGVIQMRANNKIYTLVYKFKDRERAASAIGYAKKKIEEAKGIKKQTIFEMVAHTGTTLEVYDTYLIINFMRTGGVGTNLANVWSGGGTGGKRINYSDITAIQFKEPAGVTVGFIQFAYPGSLEAQGSVVAAINNENTIPVSPQNLELARKIVEFIENRRQQLKNAQAPVMQQNSAADELKKYKELLDMGAITQEEFDAKKKQLLGL